MTTEGSDGHCPGSPLSCRQRFSLSPGGLAPAFLDRMDDRPLRPASNSPNPTSGDRMITAQHTYHPVMDGRPVTALPFQGAHIGGSRVYLQAGRASRKSQPEHGM
jgi:hypothetical protein